jgi:hypothetical protein
MYIIYMKESVAIYGHIDIHANLQKRVLKTPRPYIYIYLKQIYVYIYMKKSVAIYLYIDIHASLHKRILKPLGHIPIHILKNTVHINMKEYVAIYLCTVYTPMPPFRTVDLETLGPILIQNIICMYT